MKKLCSIFILILLASGSLSAQYYTNQNKVWTFGHNAGLNFVSGSPVAFTSGINVGEGGASVSDASGNLLFYTDGKSVWNKMSNLMPSGVSIVSFLTYSTTQSSVIIPVLSDPDRYYIFSLEQTDSSGVPVNTSHLAYSIVDMTLNGGLGDVVAASAGTPIDSMLSEKMIAIAGNNCNIWLLVHKRNTAKFLAYAITSAGINFSPVVSSVGLYPDSYVIGVIKVSPNRQKIVNMNNGGVNAHFRTELYDFDPNTGLVSDFDLINTFSSPYGAEFSPDNTKLYASYTGSGNSGVFQYDISQSTISATIASKYTVVSPAPFCDLKLAPDNKIYFKSFPSGKFLDCISAPNDSGSACSYVNKAVNLSPDSCAFGLPNVVWTSQPFLSITGDTALCQGAITALSNTSTGGTWSSSNTAIAMIVQATGAMVTVAGVSAGIATITYATLNCGFVTANIRIYQMPAPITGPLKVCTGDMIVLGSSPGGGTWSSSNDPVASVNSIGGVTGITTGPAVITYSLAGSCFRTASVTVNQTPPPITGNTHLCSGRPYTLNDTAAGGTWSISNTSLATIIPITGVVMGLSAGNTTITYTTTAGCIATTTISVTLSPDAGIITGQPRVCLDTLLSLHETTTGGIWSISDPAIATINSGNGDVHALTQGVVIITYTKGPDGAGCLGMATYTVTISSQPGFTIISNVSQVACYGENNGSITAAANGGVQPFEYAWLNSSIDSALTGLAPGPYVLTVTELATQCIAVDTFYITQPDSLHIAAEIINDKCKSDTGSISITVSGGASPYAYLWADSTIGNVLQHLLAGFYTVTVTDSNSCTKTRSMQVADNNCDVIIVHDVITPNNDGINDTWVIEGLSIYPNNTVAVFDKWGDIVFEKTNYNNDWNGKGKTGELPDGTYYYLIKLNAPNTLGGPNAFTGAVLIKR